MHACMHAQTTPRAGGLSVDGVNDRRSREINTGLHAKSASGERSLTMHAWRDKICELINALENVELMHVKNRKGNEKK